ncbi:DJ-1/PfpI family protein [Microbispora siamensis]|uniref:DJ-1/PfpI family protein n=1 Tax=Microbispora siamensis TaxID=564413 RepID=UPI001EF182EF|nr:DJ-1/PfpI family protein [Microbispora siamensis]
MPPSRSAAPAVVSDLGVPRFDLRAVGGDPGPLTTTGGIRLTAPYGLDALADAATVVVPSWRGPAQLPPEPALAALRDAHTDGATVVGLCRGAFVLAAAGLLNGRRAATHWLYAPAYPEVKVDATVLFVDDGDLITSAGTAAGIDACLHLVRRRFGTQVANTIARRMVVPPQRGGGQAQYIEHPLPDPDTDDPLGEILSHAIRHLDDPGLDVDSLARHAQREASERGSESLVGHAPQARTARASGLERTAHADGESRGHRSRDERKAIISSRVSL